MGLAAVEGPDRVLAKLVLLNQGEQMVSDGIFFVGSLKLPKNQREKNTNCQPKRRSMGFATACWWHQCQLPALRRSWATTNPSSPTRRTCTSAESCPASLCRCGPVVLWNVMELWNGLRNTYVWRATKRKKQFSEHLHFFGDYYFDLENFSWFLMIYGTLRAAWNPNQRPVTVQVNRHLLKDLIARELWTDEMRVKLIAHNGSALEQPNGGIVLDLFGVFFISWSCKLKKKLKNENNVSMSTYFFHCFAMFWAISLFLGSIVFFPIVFWPNKLVEFEAFRTSTCHRIWCSVPFFF